MSTLEGLKKRLQQDWFDFLKKNSKKLASNSIEGASPPSIFVGQKGYPKVSIGPLVPPIHGNTSILDNPEAWTNKTLEQIVNYRMNLIRGIMSLNVNCLSNRYVESLQEISMSTIPVESTLDLEKKPLSTSNIFSSSEDINMPSMLTAPVSDFKSFEVKADPNIQKIYYDNDMRSIDAMVELYHEGIPISQISKILSVGMMGRKKSRKLVPTRWSISATDQGISDNLINKIKDFPSLDIFKVFRYSHLANRYSVILCPSNEWSFQMVECWFDSSGGIAQGSDYEGSNGIKHYPQIAGAYFAGRLAIAEYLQKTRKVAAALILREIFPMYVLPVGVWQIREGVRMAMKMKYEKFYDFESALRFVSASSSVSKGEWLQNIKLLKEKKFQKTIVDWM